jgi:hypothetical protein
VPNSAGAVAGGPAGGSTSGAAAGVLPGTAASKGGTSAGTEVLSVLPVAGLPGWLPGIYREAGTQAPGILGGPIEPPTPALQCMASWSTGADAEAMGSETVVLRESLSAQQRTTSLRSGEGQPSMTRAQLRRMLV